VETLLCRPAPLFDSGTSLWCNAPLEELRRGNFTFASKPFRPEPVKQFMLVSDLSWIDICNLEGFTEEAMEVFAQNELLNERVSCIEDGLAKRVERICSIRRYLL
jgi:hypothetical protein